MIQNGARPVALELLRLQQSTRTYLAIVRDSLPAAIRLGEDGAFLLDLMHAAQLQTEYGTPAAIVMELAELIGES